MNSPPSHAGPRPSSTTIAFPTSAPPDEELLLAARQGSSSAAAELYDRHCGPALRIAAAFETHEYLAEDLVADAFTSLLRSLAAGGGPHSAVRGYLAATMRNAAASHRRRRRHPASPRLADDEQLHAVPDSAPAVDHGLLREHTRRDLAAAFGQLHPSWQQVLVLTAVDGLGVGEAGARLGLTPTAARALVYRARRAFQHAYAAGLA